MKEGDKLNNKKVEEKSAEERLKEVEGKPGSKETKLLRNERSPATGLVTMLVTVLLAVVLSAMVALYLAPSKGAVTNLGEDLAGFSSHLTTLQGKVGNLETSVAGKASTGSVTELAEKLEGLVPADFSEELANLETLILDEVDNIEASIDANGANVTLLEEKIALLEGGLDYSLSGSGGYYTLTVTSGRAGDYVGRVTLVYDSPVLLEGSFYETALLDFYAYLDNPNRDFLCRVVDNGYRELDEGVYYWYSEWELVEVTFNTKGFILETNIEQSFTVDILGLGEFSDYGSVYIEVLPGCVEEATPGGGI